MRILIVLNGSGLKRWGGDLPAQLMSAAADAGEQPRIVVTRSLEHMNRSVESAIERGVDVVFAGGGDGTLHHLVNHPMVHRTTVAMLPVGTINAFLRACGTDVSNPVDAFRQLLRGRIVNGHVGRINDRRFACFASWGFDARVIHANPAALKRYLHAASYAVTGVTELIRPARACRGRMAVPGMREPVCATSVIVSKICNYAGMNSFCPTVDSEEFGALYTDDDSMLSMAALWATIAVRGTFKMPQQVLPFVRDISSFRKLRWRSVKPVSVQMDGEAVVIGNATKIMLDTDPVRQRYLLPA